MESKTIVDDLTAKLGGVKEEQVSANGQVEVRYGECVTVGFDPKAKLPNSYGLKKKYIRILDKALVAGDFSRSALTLFFDQKGALNVVNSGANQIRIFGLDQEENSVVFLQNGATIGGNELKSKVGENPSILIKTHTTDLLLFHVSGGGSVENGNKFIGFRCEINPKFSDRPRLEQALLHGKQIVTR